MYLITYQKSNGEVFCRIRNTMPQCGIGKETSMGWKLIDVKYSFKGGYYSLRECNKLQRRQYKKDHIKRTILNIFKSYNISLALLILIFVLIK